MNQEKKPQRYGRPSFMEVNVNRVFSVIALFFSVFLTPLLGLPFAIFSFIGADRQKKQAAEFYDKKDWLFALITLIVITILALFTLYEIFISL